jgi:hypothetical protein
LLTNFTNLITNSKADLKAVGYEDIVIDDFYDVRFDYSKKDYHGKVKIMS